MKESEERRAVHIAAVVMDAAGLCLYEDKDLCPLEPARETCTACIEKWLLQKAAEELRGECIARKLEVGDWIKCADEEDKKLYLQALSEEGYDAVAKDLWIVIRGMPKES